MTDRNYLDVLEFAMDALSHGRAFLTVNGETPNTMTIGWGTIGYIWGKPVFMVVVRPQRHTYGLIESAKEFTVSIPTREDLSGQLRFAGTESGRDGNKFSGHGLTAVPGKVVNAPIVKECGLHFEMKTLLAQKMTEDQMDALTLSRCYPERDLHTMYFGEIVACYSTDD